MKVEFSSSVYKDEKVYKSKWDYSVQCFKNEISCEDLKEEGAGRLEIAIVGFLRKVMFGPLSLLNGLDDSHYLDRVGVASDGTPQYKFNHERYERADIGSYPGWT
jgi:hypothetical protein